MRRLKAVKKTTNQLPDDMSGDLGNLTLVFQKLILHSPPSPISGEDIQNILVKIRSNPPPKKKRYEKKSFCLRIINLFSFKFIRNWMSLKQFIFSLCDTTFKSFNVTRSCTYMRKNFTLQNSLQSLVCLSRHAWFYIWHLYNSIGSEV